MLNLVGHTEGEVPSGRRSWTMVKDVCYSVSWACYGNVLGRFASLLGDGNIDDCLSWDNICGVIGAGTFLVGTVAFRAALRRRAQAKVGIEITEPDYEMARPDGLSDAVDGFFEARGISPSASSGSSI